MGDAPRYCARSVDDAELAVAAQAGDRDAFAAIYDRYADRIHDFCCSLLRDRDEAADATQDSFLLASQRIGQLRQPESLRAWLYAIARREAIKRGKARARMVPTEEVNEVEATGPLPEDDLRREETQALVWEATGGLEERDRAALDLHYRQGLRGQELAEAMETTPQNAANLVKRATDRVERSLGALLVARRGSKDCDDLRAILAEWDGSLTPLVRKRVARHVDGCDTCSASRRSLASAAALLAAAPLIPAPLALRDRIMERLSSAGVDPILGDVAVAADEDGEDAAEQEADAVGSLDRLAEEAASLEARVTEGDEVTPTRGSDGGPALPEEATTVLDASAEVVLVTEDDIDGDVDDDNDSGDDDF